MFDSQRLRGTWLHRALDDVGSGVLPRLDFLARLREDGLVDPHEVPPILTAEGTALLDALGPYAPTPRLS